MAIVRAVKSGNWSDTTVWNTEALPTSADDVYSNTFTVTIDTSPTVLSVRNTAATGVTVGGSFVPTNGITLTCTAVNGVVANVGAIGCIDSALTTGQSCTIVANLSVTSNGSALRHTGAGTVNITGSSIGGTAANSHGVRNTGTGTISITGNVTGGNAGRGASNESTGRIDIIGTVTGGAGSSGASNTSTGILTITGTCQAGAAAAVDGVQGGTIILTGPFLTNNVGNNPVTAARWFWANSSPPTSYYQIRSADLSTIRPLYTADSVGGNPAVNNVRSGTIYGPNSELTGTCAVPPAASVLNGVPVDNTTGTATISAADIRAAVGLASANLDTQLSGKPTAAQIRTELSTELSRIDANISSRLDSTGTLARVTLVDTTTTLTNAPNVPTPTEIADQVRIELTPELDRIDVDISSRLSPEGTLARVTLTDTVTDLTNSPDVPTPEEIAEQVRVELNTELGRLANCSTTQEVADMVEGVKAN